MILRGTDYQSYPGGSIVRRFRKCKMIGTTFNGERNVIDKEVLRTRCPRDLKIRRDMQREIPQHVKV